MAEGGVIGALRVIIGADTAQLEEGLKKTNAALDTFGKRVAAVATGNLLSESIAKTTHAIIEFTKSSFESIDALGKQAQKVGVSVEEFSALSVAATLADVSTESLATGMGKLSKNMLEASKGTGEAQKTFEALGIEVKNSDGTLKSVTQVLDQVADRFEKSKDSATKTATAMILFGKSGKDLIPMLNDGSHGLKEMRDLAEDLGLIIGTKTFNAVQKFNDNLKILSLVNKGIANLIIAELAPALAVLTDEFVKSAREGGGLRDMAKKIGEGLVEFIITVHQTIVVSTLLGSALKELQSIVEALVGTTADFAAANEAFNNIKEILDKLPASLAAARREFEGLLKIAVNKKPVDDMASSASELQKTLDSLRLRAAVARGEFANLAAGFPEQAAKLFNINDAANKLSLTTAGLTKEQRDLNQAMLENQGAALVNAALPAWQQYEKEIATANMLLREGAITADEAALISKKAAQSTGQAWEIAGEKIATDLASGLKAFAEQNKAFAVAAKAAAIAQAIISTYAGANKALEIYGPTPVGFAAMAAAIVAGIGNVLKIQATKFATGGSFKVGGGMTGVDSQLVAFKATPGEMVDVRRPGQQSGGVQTIQLGMPRADDFFSNHVREMVEALNKAAPDGYVLKVPA